MRGRLSSWHARHPPFLLGVTMSAEATGPVPPPPTRVRYMVLAFLGALALILYIDRICISQAVSSIKEELDIDNTQMGYVLAAFTLAYCLFEVPTGAWGDRFGSRG